MGTPNDELFAKIGSDKQTPCQVYDQKWGAYEDKMPVDITKVPTLPEPAPSPIGPVK
jgi:hypothetical protein